MGNQAIVVGGGPAGIQAAATLAEAGVKTLLIEAEDKLGGKVKNWHLLFPDLTPGHELVERLVGRLNRSGAEVRLSTRATAISDRSVTLEDGTVLKADAVIVCTGYELFDARIKEEYGYGIYPDIVTTVDLERMMNEGSIRTTQGRLPQRVALLHCVGSRDVKVGQLHCSRVCCITAVKQAIELRKLLPDAEIYNFYMDIRMFGAGYEEMYRSAQQDHNITFIRGRISEAGRTVDNRIQIKAEDTLVGRPMKMTVDMLVLAVGMSAGETNSCLANCEAVRLAENGFVEPRNAFEGSIESGSPRIFYAGTVTAPKNIGESLHEASAAASRVISMLR